MLRIVLLSSTFLFERQEQVLTEHDLFAWYFGNSYGPALRKITEEVKDGGGVFYTMHIPSTKTILEWK